MPGWLQWAGGLLSLAAALPPCPPALLVVGFHPASQLRWVWAYSLGLLGAHPGSQAETLVLLLLVLSD